jgi:hypothetical protein
VWVRRIGGRLRGGRRGGSGKRLGKGGGLFIWWKMAAFGIMYLVEWYLHGFYGPHKETCQIYRTYTLE